MIDMDKEIMDYIADDWHLDRLTAEMPEEYMDYKEGKLLMKNNANNSIEKNVINWTRCGADLIEEDGTRYGTPMGTPTVKELIAILSQLPEDYRVTCCGGENYLYLFPEDKSITIDNECYLA